MHKKLLLTFATLSLLTACSTMRPVAGLEAGKMVRYGCEGHDFSARIEDDFTSARVRTPEGSVNLPRVEGDMFKGDGWTLAAGSNVQLTHKDKVVSKNCKKET